MKPMFRLVVIGALLLVAFLAMAIGMAQNTAALLAPAHLMLFVLGLAVYLVPTALAVYRGCAATPWVAAVNVFLGWTIVGWFAALGWAVGGKTQAQTPAIAPPSQHPVTGH